MIEFKAVLLFKQDGGLNGGLTEDFHKNPTLFLERWLMGALTNIAGHGVRVMVYDWGCDVVVKIPDLESIEIEQDASA